MWPRSKNTFFLTDPLRPRMSVLRSIHPFVRPAVLQSVITSDKSAENGDLSFNRNGDHALMHYGRPHPFPTQPTNPHNPPNFAISPRHNHLNHLCYYHPLHLSLT